MRKKKTVFRVNFKKITIKLRKQKNLLSAEEKSFHYNIAY